MLESYNLSDANVPRLKAFLATLIRLNSESPTSFDLSTFYNYKKSKPKSYDELVHTCGTSACIVGVLGVTPEFKAAGGRNYPAGISFNKEIDDDAMAEYFNIPRHLAADMTYNGGIFGDISSDDVKLSQVIEVFEEIIRLSEV